MPTALQVKLLRFLQDHRVERIGGHGEIAVDARVITATNGDLAALMAETASARTSTTASASSRSRCRRCATARTTWW